MKDVAQDHRRDRRSIVIAWKLLKGLIGLLVGVAVAGLVIYGAMKLVEGPKRIK